AHPNIKFHNFEEDGSFVYEAEVDIRPEFELGQYKGIEVEQPEILVTDDEIDQELEKMRVQMAPLRSVTDRGIAEGDVVLVDFQGYHDGKPMEQVLGKDQSVDVGSGRMGKEFEENLMGLKKGENASKETPFPAEFPNPVLAGKNIEFKIDVKDVKERVLADLDDEFAKDVGKEFNTLAELKDNIKSEKLQQKEEGGKGDLSDKIMMKLVESHDFEVPERLVVYEAEMLVKEMDQNLQRQGLSLEATGMNRDDLAKNYRESAERRVRGDFIIKKIAEAEELKINEEDIENGFKRIAGQYNMSIAEVKKYFAKREDLLPYMNELLNEKVVEFLREQADIKRVPADEGEKADNADSKTGEDA
ncbi:MAG: trigger factor, partial [Desulfobulbaceae bacterium]|nr:trigger factor [Desulfobulbaceae bacterium]